jgi:hypothetical protein
LRQPAREHSDASTGFVDNVTKQPNLEAQTPTEVAPVPKERTTSSVSAGIGRAYERFLGLPVWVVLSIMWVGGAALLGACALAVYVVASVLVGIAAGASF